MVTTITPPTELKILLVEDEPLVMMIHQRMLMDMGYTPDCAKTGEEAVKLAENNYRVILMDIGLPGMSGIEAAAKIRQREATQAILPAYIIAITAYTDNALHEQCYEAGIDEVHLKPITPPALQALLAGIKKPEWVE